MIKLTSKISDILNNTDDYVYIIDFKRKFLPLTNYTNGEIVNIGPCNNNYLNMFDINTDWGDKDDHFWPKLDLINAFCSNVLNEKYGLSPSQQSIIEQCVKEIYQPYFNDLSDYKNLNFNKALIPTLMDFYNSISKRSEPEIQIIPLALELYCFDSLKMFSHKTNVNTNSRFVVYDLSDIPAFTNLNYTLICINHIWNKVAENCNNRKKTWLYIDFPWSFNKYEENIRYFRSLYKRARTLGLKFLNENLEEMFDVFEIKY